MLLKEREITQKSPKLEFEVKRTRKLVHNILRVRGQVPYSPEINILDRHPEFSALKSGYNEEALTKHWPLILVTGGCGYIGSHVVLELLKQAEFGVVVVDSLSNSCLESLRRVSYIASQTVENLPPIYFHQTDIRDEARLCQIFGCYVQLDGACTIQHVIHFAALKSVNASRLDPLEYYSTNVTGTAVLLKTMKNFRVQSLVFSSSAVVYGSQAGSGKEGEINRLSETCCKILSGQPASERAINYGRVTNPYGQTKLKCEELIHEISQSNIKSFNLRSIILRYTNPSGNDPSGLIGDSPVQAENLMPIASQVLQGRREYISIYGTNYPTRDGTGIRDFIHVQDLAKGHLAALKTILQDKRVKVPYPENCRTYNLGTGRGASVLEVLTALMKVSGKTINTSIAPRRPGDLAVVVCDSSRAERELHWKAQKSVFEMARDLWTFCVKNPMGLENSQGWATAHKLSPAGRHLSMQSLSLMEVKTKKEALEKNTANQAKS